MKIVQIYTDGACSGNQNEENIGGWGCILDFKGVQKELYGGEKNTTNNRMELMALISALKALKEKGLSIQVFADSSYLINCFQNKWYVKWQQNGWKTSGKAPVENKELWEELLGLMEGQDLSFKLVKGHLNPEWDKAKLKPYYDKFCQHNGPASYEEFMKAVLMNNRADALANQYMDENR